MSWFSRLRKPQRTVRRVRPQVELLDRRDCPSTLTPVDGFAVDEGATVDTVLANLSDADINAVEGDFSATILWGDGQTSTGTVALVSPGNFTVSGSHSYADDGPHTVTVTVNDGLGDIDTTLEVNVANVAPTLTLSGAASITEGLTYTLNLASSDPGSDSLTGWVIYWGDGSTDEVPGSASSVNHVFFASTGGPMTISATAADEDGSWDAGNTLAVTVNNIAPTLTLNLAYEGQRTVTLSGQITDPNAAGLFVYFSGAVETSVFPEADGSFSITVDASSLGTVTALVTDAGGLSASANVNVTSDAPVILSFIPTWVSGTIWTFSGSVQDESAAGLTLAFSGLSSLEGQTTTVLSDGTFSLTLELQEGEQGCANALVSDWWNLASELAEALVNPA